MKKIALFAVAVAFMAQSAAASAAGTLHVPLFSTFPPHISGAAIKTFVVTLTHVGKGQALTTTLPGITLLQAALKR